MAWHGLRRDGMSEMSRYDMIPRASCYVDTRWAAKPLSSYILLSTLPRPTASPAPSYPVSACSSCPHCPSGTAYPSLPLLVPVPLNSAGAFTSQIPSSTSLSKRPNLPLSLPFLTTHASNPSAAAVPSVPRKANAKSALYALHTLEPTSLSQPSRLQLECSVPLLHHASRANETAHSAASAPFNARLMVGLSPWRRWRKSVKARTRRVRRETVRSYWLLAVGHGRGWEKRTRMNVQGKVYPSFLSSRRK